MAGALDTGRAENLRWYAAPLWRRCYDPPMQATPDLRVELPGERPAVREIASEAGSRLQKLVLGLGPLERTYLETTPLAAAVATFDAFPPFSDYWTMAPGVRALENEVEAHGGAAWKALVSRLVLYAMLERLPSRRTELHIPAAFWPEVERGLAGLLDALGDSGAVDWSADAFLKDVSVAQLRLVPCHGVGKQAVRVRPWRLLGYSQRRERLSVIKYLGAGCFQPAILVDSHAWQGFGRANQQSPEDIYESFAQLMAANPRSLGSLHTGWPHDPKLKGVSPHVLRLAEFLIGIGGRRFHMRTKPYAVLQAISTSATRRQRYEDGTYQPAVCGIIVKRTDLLRWARPRWATGGSTSGG